MFLMSRQRTPSRRLESAPTAPDESATQRIVDALTCAIVERRLMPGTKLVEQKVADVFQVSRTLVRQAFNKLSRDHLITLSPGRGAHVSTPSPEEARQVFELRDMLDTALVRRLAKTITPEQVARLRRHLADERAAIQRVDISGRTRLLADFHVLLAEVSGNQVLARLQADLLSRSSLIALMYQSSHSAHASSADHSVIVDALEQRDGARAARLASQHLSHVARDLQGNATTDDLAAILQQEIP